MNVLEIVIAAAVIIFAVWGYYRGFVRKLASILTLVLSVVLVSAVLPYVTDFIKDRTPIYGYIEAQCERMLTEQLTGGLTSSSESASALNLDRDQIKSLLESYGYDSSVVDYLSDEQLDEYVQYYASEYLGDTESVAIDAGSESEIIESLPVPDFLKNLLLNNNNDSGYASLSVTSFQDYLTESVASLILNAVSFIIALILVQIVLRLLIAALNILSRFPVVNFVNRLAGLALGLLEALFFLWLFFLILTVMQMTDIGQTLMLMVEQSSLLTWLYESNLFLRIVVEAAALFAA